MNRTTSIALRAGLLAIGLLLGQLAAAGPPHGRMQPDERERLRQELREQRRAERERAADAGGRSMPAAQSPVPAPGEPSGWSNPQQGQSSDPQWRRDARREGMHRGAAPPGHAQREQLSPEERRQLRTLLRERHREHRQRRPDDGR